MNIDITIDDTDTDALSAFCFATGYTEDFGSQQDWLLNQVNNWITQNMQSGFIRQNSADSIAAYQSALVAASNQMQQQMQQVSIGTSSGGVVISPPIKLPPQ
jgi:hypothetical protein